jgi:hypothetical protein
MRSFAIKIFLLLAVCAANLTFSVGGQNSDETYPVRIVLEPRPDARFYQIEWLENDEVSTDAEAREASSLREKITRTEIKRDLPIRFRFFRLRSAYRDGLFGPWGEVVEIQRPVKVAASATDTKQTPGTLETKSTKKVTTTSSAAQNVFAPVVDKNGKQKWILRGNSIVADQLTSVRPFYYEVECLTEKDALENTNGRKKYETPLQFTRSGQFKLSLFRSEDIQETEPIQSWIFWVYTDIPRTYVKFYAPFLHGRGGFTVGGKTRIALLPEYSPAVIDKVEYRIFAEGSPAGPWLKYEDEIEVASFAQGQHGFYQIEYRATNVAGNTEAPQQRRMLVDAHGPQIEELAPENGERRLVLKDENFPIIVRIYKGEVMIEDKYYKFWKANDFVRVPAGATQIKVIDLLGNETIDGK